MTPDSQVLLSVGIPTIAVLIGILINGRQIDALRSEMNVRFQALETTMTARFESAHQALLRVEGVLDSRLRRLEEHD